MRKKTRFEGLLPGNNKSKGSSPGKKIKNLERPIPRKKNQKGLHEEKINSFVSDFSSALPQIINGRPLMSPWLTPSLLLVQDKM